MAYFELSGSKGFVARIYYSETYDITTNTSTIQIDNIKFKNTAMGGYPSYLSGDISIGGTKILTMSSASGYHIMPATSQNTFVDIDVDEHVKQLPWKSNVIKHNSDGTGSTTISIYIKFVNDTNNYNGGIIDGTQNITLFTIPRGSSLSLSDSSVYVGDTITANISRHKDNFTHTVEFYINDTYYKKYTGVTTSQSYKIDESWYGAMPSSVSCTAYCKITTYSGSTQIGGTVQKSFTVNIPSTIIPSVGTIKLDPLDITTSDGTSRNILVKGKNKLKISVSGCVAGTGSSIKSYTFYGPDISSTTTNTSVTSSSSISSAGILTYTVTVTDNRGRSASKNVTISCEDYDTPSFTSFSAYRVGSSSSTTADDKGTYVRCTYNLAYSSVNSTNNVDVRIFYKKNTENSWSSILVATDSTSTSENKILSSIDASSAYTIYAQATDNYGGTVSSTQITIFGESRILNIRPDGNGISFGKMAETDNLFECRWPAKFDDDMEIVGDVTVPDSGGPILNGYSVGTLGPGTSISSGDDLNNYITAGVFRCTGSTIAETLANTPHTTGGFKLVVEYLGGPTYFRQVVIPRVSSCKYYIRYNQSGTWYAWKTFESSDAIDTAISKIDLSSINNLTIGANRYHTNSLFGIDMSNSDIMNVNGIYFKDVTDAAGEGINFYRSDGYWDTLYVLNGALRFHPNRATNTSLGGHIVLNGNNFRRGTCTLSSSEDVTVTFSSALAGTPTVMLTPLTSTAGVIPGKVKSVSTTGFVGTIGGSAVSSAKFAYLAIYN